MLPTGHSPEGGRRKLLSEAYVPWPQAAVPKWVSFCAQCSAPQQMTANQKGSFVEGASRLQPSWKGSVGFAEIQFAHQENGAEGTFLRTVQPSTEYKAVLHPKRRWYLALSLEPRPMGKWKLSCSFSLCPLACTIPSANKGVQIMAWNL